MSSQLTAARRLIAGLLVAVLVATTLGACQPTPTPVPPTKAPTAKPASTAIPPTPVPPTAVPPTVAPKKITWATWGGAGQEDLYKAAIAKFEAAQKGVKVENINTANFNDHVTKIQTMIAGGTPPDVIMMGGEWIPAFADKGIFGELDPYMQKDSSFKLDDYYPNLLEAMKYKGKFYALPKDFNITVLYYNAGAFDKAGLKYPTRDWTWADLLNAAKQLTAKDASGRVTRYGLCYTNPWFLILQNGGETFDRDIDPKVVRITEPPALEAMQWYYELSLKHKVSPTDAELSQGGGRQEFFASGRLAMLADHRGATVPFANIKDFKWDMVELPQGKKRATTLNTAGYGIAAGSKNGDAAWQFLKWLTGPEGVSVFVAGGNALPGVKSLANDPAMKVQKPFLDSIPYARPFFASPKWAEIGQVVGAEMQLMATGQKTVEQGCKDIKAKLDPILAK